MLLHGFPQTHYMWRTVAQLLAAHHTVIAPDLRGYGKRDKPIADDPATYSKRTMGDDIVHITRSLGIHRFGVVGHVRGALVAVRAGLDHPEEITFLGILDVLPTLDTWAVLQGVHAKVAWHLYLMAQPAGLPEKMIAAVAVISQDWGGQLGFDAATLWRAWAPNFTYQSTSSGHFMAEENPDEIVAFIRELDGRERQHNESDSPCQ